MDSLKKVTPEGGAENSRRIELSPVKHDGIVSGTGKSPTTRK